LIPKKNRTEVYKFLFSEGVLYAKKDFEAPKHPEIDVPNLQVMGSPMHLSLSLPWQA
jgi:small subunit ribosomal protein S10e